ncbi:C3HC zinc finger-like-domain-containing protein [Amylostereum chailletii]|nr:C3HC zinc finger-like-domain-containing protein [Amylostereum chailletii]
MLQRKLEDAIQSLDEATAPLPDPASQPPPLKRQNTFKSLYSTLAKYGIHSKQPQPAVSDAHSADLSKAPHLAAILSRTATKTRKALPNALARLRSTRTASPSAADYRPSSTPAFLVRLATFKLSTYANKPPTIDAVSAAKCGWINDGKDRLVCGICNSSWVVVGREGMNRQAANALIEKQAAQLVGAHKDGCPWKIRQCDADVYRIPLSSPAVLAKELKLQAIKLDTFLEGVEVRHPLTSTQVQALTKAIASVEADTPFTFTLNPTISPSIPSPLPEPRTAAILAALFGWILAPPPAPSIPPSRSRTPSVSRATSVAPSMPITPRRPSRLGVTKNMVDTPGTPRTVTPDSAPSTPRPMLSRVNSHIDREGSTGPEVRGALLQCALCHRRLGLWTARPPLSSSQPTSAATDSLEPAPAPPARQIDLLKEHRPYCPYVIKSTSLPSLPIQPTAPCAVSHVRAGSSTTSLGLAHATVVGSAIGGGTAVLEGWRAVLAVVLRYRMGQKRKDSLLKGVTDRMDRADAGGDGPGPTKNASNGEEADMDVDLVEAMVEGVKSRGGRELLKYVKGILG